jgi:dUTPase
VITFLTHFFMEVRIKNQSGKALEYKTSGACAFDFESLEDYVFAPGEWKLVDTGTVIATPAGYCLMIAPRSGTFKNF